MKQIKNRYTGEFIFEADVSTMRKCVELAASSGANLECANMRGADLRGAAGNRKEIVSLFLFDEYTVVYTSEYLQSGCERHLISEWREFDGRRILEMDGKTALNFWKENKELIFRIIEHKPAKPTCAENK